VAGLPAGLVHLQTSLEFASQARILLQGARQQVFHWRNERFQQAIPDRDLKEADVVIGFDTSSWILAQRCRTLGRPFVLVQTTTHPDAKAAVITQLAAQFPPWETTYPARLPLVREAEQIEYDYATRIVCGSNFARQTLVDHGVARQKICTVPYGVNSQAFRPAAGGGRRPFRFVFVGSISAAKGVPLLLSTWQSLAPKHAELWLVGSISAEVRALLPNLPGLRFFGKVPGGQVPEILRQCDVFVFPSYFEGFGRVILQAMACGLPVITTTDTAGPDLVLGDGQGGWVIAVGNRDALHNAMAYCILHPQKMPAIGRIARQVAKRYDWETYGRNWLSNLHSVRAGAHFFNSDVR
jgi:glycosyltransferase involved in cell wall biosynthesis